MTSDAECREWLRTVFLRKLKIACLKVARAAQCLMEVATLFPTPYHHAQAVMVLSTRCTMCTIGVACHLAAMRVLLELQMTFCKTFQAH